MPNQEGRASAERIWIFLGLVWREMDPGSPRGLGYLGRYSWSAAWEVAGIAAKICKEIRNA